MEERVRVGWVWGTAGCKASQVVRVAYDILQELALFS